MLVTAGLLAVLAVLLADPVPRLLTKAQWVRREPVAGLVLWQAVGLGAGLALLGAGLEFAFSRLGDSLPAAVLPFGRNLLHGEPFVGWDWFRVLTLVVTVALGLRLFLTLMASVIRVLAGRRQQRAALDLIATPWPARPGVLVLDHPTAVAYCLPGTRSRLVVSKGALDVLTPAQLEMVIAHERAHLRLRHDLVVLPFVAWGAALPFLGSVRRAQRAVAALVEMMADDAAAGTAAEAADLRTALDRLSGPAAESATVRARSERLAAARATLPVIRVLAYAAAVGLILLPTLLVVLPAFGSR